MNIEGVVNNLWDAVYSQTGQQLNAEGASWNNIIHPHSETGFGFCADRSTTPEAPPICNDGLDNDKDDLIDYPDDPGCSSPDDDNETDAAETLTIEVVINNDWSTGYCADVIVSNGSTTAVDWEAKFDIEGAVSNLWSAQYSQQGNTIIAEGLSWNNFIPGGSSVNFGFCANK